MYSNSRTKSGAHPLKIALLVAAAIELPLFVSLFALVFLFQKGPVTTSVMILYFSQFPAVIIAGPLGSLNVREPIAIAIEWAGILIVQFSLFALVIYWMVKSTRNNP